ncbi:hypothetical protein SB748_01800 [Rhizobium sp. SIMBA_035]
MSVRRHHTQWAAQFAVASELCKLGCDVGFTMGHNTPLADLFVLSPSRKTTFLVDVKGQKTANFWQIKKKELIDNLFYVLAYVPTVGRNRFFIFSQSQLNERLDQYEKSGVRFDPRFSGFNWTTAYAQEDKWNELPLGDGLELGTK